MSKRKDLNRRNESSNYIPRQNPYSFYMNENNINQSETPQNNESHNNDNDYNDSIDEFDESNSTNTVEKSYNNDTNAMQNNNIFSTRNNIEGEDLLRNNNKEIIRFALKNPVVRNVVLVGVLISFILLILVFMIAAISDDSSNGRLATSGYYAIKCPEVTVYMADKSQDYKIIDTKTYDLEDYVAGVVAAEVGMFNNLEVYKEFALAARTYFLANESDCSIESSDRWQVFRETDNSLIHQAAEETKGKVILTDGELRSVQYDAFCSIEVTDENYILMQANQPIPRSWADSQSGIAEAWKQGTCEGNHGNGLSQWGSYYLATTENYTFEELLHYYLGDNITISRGGFMSSIPGLEIKSTLDAQTLNDSLSDFLPANGTSVQELNDFIRTSVKENGAGTREGVVTAAVSLINYLYDGLGVKLPYYWNGKYSQIGVNPNFGGYTNASDHGEVYAGFDCSGFVSWAIVNGGYNFSSHSTVGFNDAFSSNSCRMGESSCIGQPGDLINAPSCHVQLIVAVDEASGTYYVAESGPGLVINQVSMYSGGCGANTRIIYMDEFYNNQSNVNMSY